MTKNVNRLQKKRVANKIIILLLKYDLNGFLKQEDEHRLQQLKEKFQKLRS